MLGGEILHDLAADEGLGEATRDVHRAHVLERRVQPEEVAHEDGVLVGGHLLDQGVALTDRLGEGGRVAAVDQLGEQTEGERRLAVIAAGGREIDLAHVHRVRRRNR